MKTLCEAILNHFQIDKESAKMTVKQAVLEEMDDAKCVKRAKSYAIISGGKVYGSGKTANTAWQDAALRILQVTLHVCLA